jgi:hypothetical protein
LFEDEAELVELLYDALTSDRDVAPFREAASRWDWERTGPVWDAAIERMCDRRRL